MKKETVETVTMIALREHYYGGRDLKAGETYEADPEHATLLERVGTAKPVDKKSRKEYQTRVLTAEGK